MFRFTKTTSSQTSVTLHTRLGIPSPALPLMWYMLLPANSAPLDFISDRKEGQNNCQGF